MRTEEEIKKRMTELQEHIPRCTKIYQNKLKLKIEELKWVLEQA